MRRTRAVVRPGGLRVRPVAGTAPRAETLGAVGGFATILPLSVVMIAGPQIITSFFLATSERWRANSALYVTGAALSMSAVVALSYLVFRHVGGSLGHRHHGGGAHVADYAILGLILALMLVVFLRRGSSEPPKWMGKLQNAKPRASLRLGILLLGVFPTDIMTTVTVGLHLEHHGEPLWHAVPFVTLTLLLLALPALTVLLFGKRGERVLPKARDWMNGHSWVVSEIVLLLFAGIELSSLLG